LPRYFERMYDQRWSPEWVVEEFESTYKDLIFQRVLSALNERVPATSRSLLDIGSHAGRFLHLARQAGWSAEGTEINPRTAAYAAERTGATVHRLKAEQVLELRKQYDAVTLTDVLEHIPEPVTLLTTIRRAIARNGWIAVKVPCGPAQLLKETWRARLQRGYRATVADNLVHINHFSPTALGRALERAGFSDIAIEVAAPECPPGDGFSTRARVAAYNVIRQIPGGVYTPVALHLQAFARATSDHPTRP
jgi:SAM-dependent methyltransferase